MALHNPGGSGVLFRRRWRFAGGLPGEGLRAQFSVSRSVSASDILIAAGFLPNHAERLNKAFDDGLGKRIIPPLIVRQYQSS